ncbi:MAG: hypothetical protein RI935_114 [Candidatus Parcubacteria bacterium]|jgi:hypothetical protein
MAIIPSLRKALQNSSLTFEELRAFELGLQHLEDEDQEEFTRAILENPELIYPTYINYKAKVHAINNGQEAWEEAIENEIAQLDALIERRRVGDEMF